MNGDEDDWLDREGPLKPWVYSAVAGAIVIVMVWLVWAYANRA